MCVDWSFNSLVRAAFISSGLALVGCFSNPGNQTLATPASVPVVPVYKSANDSYLYAAGQCKGDSSIIITYSSPLTPSNTIEAICSGNAISVNLPVQQGTLTQIFNVSMVAVMKNKKATPVKLVVNFVPPPPVKPGMAITSGGGSVTGAGVTQVTVYIGEPVSFTPLPSSASSTLRPNLSSIIFYP